MLYTSYKLFMQHPHATSITMYVSYVLKFLSLPHVPLLVLLPEFQGFCKQLLIQIFDNCWTFFPLSNFYYIQYSYQAVSFCLVMNICLQVTATRKTITNHECNGSGNIFFSCLVLFYRYISQLQVFRVRLINPYLTD